MASGGGSDFTDDYFEDCNCTGGHEEDDYLNHGQGVNKTTGEAPTTISGKRSGPSSGSRPTTTIRTGAKDGPSAPEGPAITQPEENRSRARGASQSFR